MCTRHPDFERARALATVIVGPVTTVSIDSLSFDAWIVNAVIGPSKEKAGGVTPSAILSSVSTIAGCNYIGSICP